MKTFYTDGSCDPNPGPGGCAVVCDGEIIYKGYELKSTNNRMEGMAILAALKLADSQPCLIYTDSMLWVNILTDWGFKWKSKGWRKRANDNPKHKISNLDIVVPTFEAFYLSNSEIRWVKGHNGDAGNELADVGAEQARRSGMAKAILSI